MKKIFIGLFLLAIALNVLGYVPDRVFWLSARTDDIPGTGAICDPFDASTQVKLDALFDSFGTTPTTVNFFPGDYYTSGNDMPRPVSIHVYSGWRVIGAGIDRTIIHYVGTDALKTVISSFYPINVETSLILDDQSYMSVADLTIDCGGFADDTRQISGVSLRGQNNNVIERVKVINSSSPENENFILWVLGCGDHDNYNNAIRDCVVENCYGSMATDFTISQAVGTGHYDIGGVIERNRALSGNIGASTWSSNSLIIRNNYFNGVNYGINTDSGNNYNAVISENVMNANSWDIVLGSSSTGVFDRFVIQNNDFVTAATGLLFNGLVTNAIIRENKFSGTGDMAMAVNNTGNIDFTLINNDLGGMGIGVLPRKANSQQPHIANANSLVTVINRCNVILLALETLGFLDIE